MAPYFDELWSLQNTPKYEKINIFLPNGLMIDLPCTKDASLENIKNEVWNMAKKDILYRLLLDKNSYIFCGITENGKCHEFYDEKKRLCDLRLFVALLKLIEPKGNKEEKVLNSNISIAIGKPLDEFDNSEDPETLKFRSDYVYFIKDIVENRENTHINQRLKFFFPPDLDEYYYLIKLRFKKKFLSLDSKNDSSIDQNYENIDSNEEIKKNLEETKYENFDQIVEKLNVCIWYIETYLEKTNKIKFEFQIDSEMIPSEIIKKSLAKIEKEITNNNDQNFDNNSQNYFLKVCGTDQYLLSEIPVLRYKYVVENISKEKIPHLLLIKKEEVFKKIPKTNFILPSFLKKNENILDKNQRSHFKSSERNFLSLWTQTHKTFSVTVHSVTYVNITDIEKIYIKAGLYLGNELLCKPQETNYVQPMTPKWNQQLIFDINMEDIPRNAKICFAVCVVKKKTGAFFAIKWANLQIFDFYGKLISGRKNLNLFPIPKGNEEILYPLGNVNSKSLETSSSLEIEFDRNKNSIIFPAKNEIIKYATFAKNLEKDGKSYGYQNENVNRHLSNEKMNIEEEKRLNSLLEKDQLSVISDEDKDFLWKWRLECKKKKPESLPKLIDSVKWNNRDEVSQLYCLIDTWDTVKAETALELLDCKYSDYFVRSQAVKWLNETISDEQLYQYLLQLVQVLKYEPYYDNELTRFLIRKSLLNRKIGHFFFWHIKSEMSDPSYDIRFGLILESYCRGIGQDLLQETIKQVDALDKLTKLTENFKMSRVDKKKKIKFLVDHLQQEDYKEALRNYINPLDFSVLLGELEVESCQIMDSAKKPLWLVWKNNDILAECNLLKSTVIFKSGDDLRQDMLALQVIKIINYIWRNEGFDLKMMPYMCLATGKQVGMIEVIKNAKTVMNIQKQRGMMAALQVDSRQLNEWIKEKNKDNYDKAVDNFTKSCAGYCVATFILGIGDRNPDNIMVREDGQIFHVDFGHFLGHFKKKLGISRERVPFVLTSDFLRVISKGSENPQKSQEFEQFSELCGKAYLSLRKHTNLLITLFTMMLYTGIPELQSIEDIEYLRTTLQVEKSEFEALTYFNEKFKEANGGNWSTKVDWCFHHVAHM